MDRQLQADKGVHNERPKGLIKRGLMID